MLRIFSSDGLSLVYYRWNHRADATPVVLHHGFASSAHGNWVAPGIVDSLVAAGHSVIAIDARGHGASAKPHDWNYYGEQRMARDLAELLSQLRVERYDLVGYSMGAVVALLLASEQHRVRRLAIGGVGEGILECGGLDTRWINGSLLIEALLAADAASIADPSAAAFRHFADRQGADRRALAAQAAAIHQQPISLDAVSAPTWVFAGDSDPLSANPERLAAALPDARLALIEGDHLSAVANPRTARGLVQFLSES